MSNAERAIPFKITKADNTALLVQHDDGPNFYSHLHYHPEIQVTAIVQGEGVLYAGNAIVAFGVGDVLLIGPNVPHLMKNSPVYFTEESPGVLGFSLFFDPKSFGERFFALQEMAGLAGLLRDASRVVRIPQSDAGEAFEKIVEAGQYTGALAVINLLSVLASLLHAPKEYLNPVSQGLLLTEEDGHRLRDVLDHTFRAYQQPITIADIAQIACMSRSQFSYFFKLHTGKSYIEFLNDLRIEYACDGLKNTDRPVEQICYEVGFQNVSHFIRLFKKAKMATPAAFRRTWQRVGASISPPISPQ